MITVYSVQYKLGRSPQRYKRYWFTSRKEADKCLAALLTNPIVTGNVDKHSIQGNRESLVSLLRTYCVGKD